MYLHDLAPPKPGILIFDSVLNDNGKNSNFMAGAHFLVSDPWSESPRNRFVVSFDAADCFPLVVTNHENTSKRTQIGFYSIGPKTVLTTWQLTVLSSSVGFCVDKTETIHKWWITLGIKLAQHDAKNWSSSPILSLKVTIALPPNTPALSSTGDVPSTG